MAKTFLVQQSAVPWEAKSEPICLPTGLYLLGFGKGAKTPKGRREREREKQLQLSAPFSFSSLSSYKKKRTMPASRSSLMHLTFRRKLIPTSHLPAVAGSALSKHWHH